MIQGFRYWRGFGISFNEETELWENLEFELELYFPVADNYIIQQFLREAKRFIYKGREIISSTVMIPPKDFFKITFTIH